MARSIPSLPDHWQNFCLCLIFHISLPLLPLGLELWRTGAVTASSATLVASMYAVSIGVSSRDKLLFGLGIIIAIIFATAFGTCLGPQQPGLPESVSLSLYSIGLMMLCHIFERYNRHVVDRTPFWTFV